MEVKELTSHINKIETEISKHIIGQDKLIKDTIICLMSGGNLLLEGVPGLGKTKLVSCLAKSLGLDFKRIQFTPDLMPADITGTNIYNREKNVFEFQKGPVFTNILLADEINRATPKTQAAMLEAMQEKSVTAAGKTHIMEKPYMVLATQNPIEQEGTYPLPEAQLDRFMFKLLVEFPDIESLTRIVNLTTKSSENEISVVSSKDEILEVQNTITTVPIAEAVMEYAMKLILATHPESDVATNNVKEYVEMGSSPRGAQNIIKAARVKAIMENRYNVAFEDIDYVAIPVLRHRLALNYQAMSQGVKSEDIVNDIIKKVKA